MQRIATTDPKTWVLDGSVSKEPRPALKRLQPWGHEPGLI